MNINPKYTPDHKFQNQFFMFALKVVFVLNLYTYGIDTYLATYSTAQASAESGASHQSLLVSCYRVASSPVT